VQVVLLAAGDQGHEYGAVAVVRDQNLRRQIDVNSFLVRPDLSRSGAGARDANARERNGEPARSNGVARAVVAAHRA
jgi:hypothetical protein